MHITVVEFDTNSTEIAVQNISMLMWYSSSCSFWL